MKAINLEKIHTYPLRKRKSKIRRQDFARLSRKRESFASFLNSLPDILAGKDFKSLLDSVIKAYRKKRPIIFMMGAHVIKCGLSPLVNDLMKRRVVTAVALNGAGIIHDTEIAMVGETSEDVAMGVKDGSFGMAKETASFINQAISEGLKKGSGIGESIGESITKAKLPYRGLSITACAYKYKVPVTVHVAIGTDTIHQHPSCNGAAVGEGSLIDFRNFIYSVARLGDGGVIINFGSVVILPEVFLKALNVARNLGHRVKNFTTANFDMVRYYRPCVNVVSRPQAEGERGCNIIGHHEITIPLLYRAIIERL